VFEVLWEQDPTLILNATSGELKGLLEVRDTTIPDLIDGLNQLAVNLRDQVNAIHATGHGIDAADSTGLAFFTGTGASDIAVNAGLTAEQIGLSSATAQNGNGDIANDMLALRDSKVMNGGTNTLNEFYNGQVTRLGRKLRPWKPTPTTIIWSRPLWATSANRCGRQFGRRSRQPGAVPARQSGRCPHHDGL
jgi:flagellar hook-associated protein 1 FlgK